MQRLAQGPVSLTFAKPWIENALATSAREIRMDDVIIEKDPRSRQPHFRLRNVSLLDHAGLVIARAPRATFRLDLPALLTAQIKPAQFELIGARIMLRRGLDGAISLGFGNTQESADGSLANAQAPIPMQPNDADTSLQDLLSGKLLDKAPSAAASLQAVLISQASIQLYDERNDAFWYAPEANMAFRREGNSFVLLANAQIAGGKDPWNVEVSAKYEAATGSIAIDARIANLIPAELSDKIYALSQFATFNLPMSGTSNLILARDGQISAANAQFNVGQGIVGFPGYVAEPLDIDEGELNLEYDPASGDILLSDSTLTIAKMRSSLSGKLQQLRDAEGRLSALNIDFALDNLDAKSQSQALSRVSVKGVAQVRDRRFDLEQLILQGNEGARGVFSGTFTEGEKSPGIQLQGKAAKIPAWMIKRLWPPVIAPDAREWFAENVLEGLVPEASLAMKVSPDQLALADENNRNLPDEAIELRFTTQNVSTRYFEQFPAIQGAHGEGYIKGSELSLLLEEGKVDMPSGQQLKLGRATMLTTNLGEKISPANFEIMASGTAVGALELLDLAPLELVKKAGLNPSDASGNVAARIKILLPLIKDSPPGTPIISAEAKLVEAGLKAAMGGINLQAGDIDITLQEDGALKAVGAVLLNSAPARVVWTKAPGLEGKENIALEATFNDEQRRSLGADTSAFATGPIGVKLAAENPRQGLSSAKVEVDLSEAALRLESLKWSRPPIAKTKARFMIDAGAADVIRIRDLVVSGGGMDVKGSLTLSSSGALLDANVPKAVLDANNSFAMTIKPDKGTKGLRIDVKGKSFDARPLISTLFQRRVLPPGENPVPLRISANFDYVIANRGESFTNVKADARTLGSFFRQIEVGGDMSNGTRTMVVIKPNDMGFRDLTVTSNDAGSVLRAAGVYSKMAGGQLNFNAELGNGNDMAIRKGVLEVTNFEVRNEAAVAEIDARGRVLNKGKLPKDRLAFDRMKVPFSADNEFVRIGDALVRGPDLGASATGTIRKSDGAMDIGGTIIPVYALNSVVGKVPLLGQLLVGGKGQGVFGITFAVRGTMKQPRTLFNPVSALAPGFLRGIFQMGGGGVNPDGTPRK